ncbi:MAG: DUF502 domain-containing protein [Proteobacteria bacterium]|nr:DUF502 domain-containing protein [Pseudomonadota bacterium]
MGSIRKQLKKYFLAGILVVVPLIITIYLIMLFISWTDNFLDFIPPSFHPRSYIPIPGWGFIMAVLIILVTGMVTTNYLGRGILHFWNTQVGRIPLIRNIYGSVRQLMESLFMQSGKHFQRVVLIEFPRPGIYAIAFITSRARVETIAKTGKKLINLFLPTAPNPTSGFFIMLPEDEITELDISVEDAFKMIISGGILSEDKFP